MRFVSFAVVVLLLLLQIAVVLAASVSGYAKVDVRAMRRRHNFREALDLAVTAGEVPSGKPDYSRAEKALKLISRFPASATPSDLGITEYHRVSFDFYDLKTGRLLERGVNEYAITLLWTFYVTCLESPNLSAIDNCAAVRSLMLRLLQAGVRADVPFYVGRHKHAGLYSGTPVGYSFVHKIDLVLASAMADAGHSVQPMLGGRESHRWPNDAPRDEYGREGYSYLHLIVTQAWTNVLVRTLYQFADALRGGYDPKVLIENTRVARFYEYSPTLQEVLQEITHNHSRVVGTSISRHRLIAIGGELREAMLVVLLRASNTTTTTSPPSPPSPLTQLDLSVHAGMNPIIIALVTGDSCVPFLRRVVDEVQKLGKGTEAWMSLRAALLSFRHTNKRRTAFHVAADLHSSSSSVWATMLHAANVLFGGEEEASSYLRSLTDIDGKSPWDLLDARRKQAGGGLSTRECDARVFDAASITREEFSAAVRAYEPFMLKGALQSWKAWELFDFARFQREYGSAEVVIESIPYASSFTIGSFRRNQVIKTTCGEYMTSWGPEPLLGAETNDFDYLPQDIPKYVFDANLIDRTPQLKKDTAEMVQFLRDRGLTEVSKQFYLGPAGSGSPFHFHGAAANFQVCPTSCHVTVALLRLLHQ